MVVERLSMLFGIEQGESQAAKRLAQQLMQTLTEEERCLLLRLIDEKNMERGLAEEQNFAAGLKVGLRLGWEAFRCEEEENCW